MHKTRVMSSMWLFIQLSRPHFLVGGFLMVALGASSAPTVDWTVYALAQLMVTAAQVTAHYVNEYFDREPDRLVQNRTWFSGGSGAIGDQRLSARVALSAARWSTMLTLAAVLLVSRHSGEAAVLGLVALMISWLYSAPPVRLLGTGWGESVTTLVVVVMAPAVGGLSQSGGVPASLWWSMALLFPAHLAMMLAFEIPDLSSDEAAGKAMLAVRIGRRWTVALMTGLYATAGLVAAGAGVGGRPFPAGLVGAAVLSAVTIRLSRTERFHLLTSMAVVTFTVAALVLIVG